MRQFALMGGYLKFIGFALLLLMGVPLGTIYRQNIEVWAEDRGLDGVFSKGLVVLSSNPFGPWLLLAFVLVLGGTAALWFEYWLRRNFPPKFSHEKSKLVQNQIFKHCEVEIDHKTFKGCKFEGVTLVYRGTGPFFWRAMISLVALASE